MLTSNLKYFLKIHYYLNKHLSDGESYLPYFFSEAINVDVMERKNLIIHVHNYVNMVLWIFRSLCCASGKIAYYFFIKPNTVNSVVAKV